MKKVLFIMPALPGGGAEKVLVDILKNMDQNKYRLTLLLEYRDGVYTSSLPKGVEVIYLYRKSNIWLERFHRGLGLIKCYHWFHSLFYRLAFLARLCGRRFDTIVSFMEGEAVRIHSYLAHKADRNVSWIHIDFKKKHWSLDFFRNKDHESGCYSKMDEVVFVSDDARRSFLDIYDLDPQKCTVLYNLIDKKEIQKLAESCTVDKSKFTICMVGRLNQQKRYDRALEAMKLLKDAGCDAELWILGVGELETELKEKAKALGVSEMCDFKGFVRPAYPYMKVADVFLNTSEAEGYPLVLCEALCLGLPVVATDITGAHEILEESKYGLLVKEDVNDIYLGLRKMIDDAELRSAYAQKSVQRSEIFSVEEVLKEIDAVL